MIYFMGFSVAANIIGKNAILDFDCDQIYQYYQIVSKTINHSSSTNAASYPPNAFDRFSQNMRATLIQTP